MKTRIILVVFAFFAILYSCKKTSNQPAEVTNNLSLPAYPAAYYGVSNLDQIATLGRVLFYDKHLSVNNAISCGSCHKQAAGFADNVALSLGVENTLTRRNSISIQNINARTPGFNYGDTMFNANSAFFWDGRENNIANLILRPVTNHVEMGIIDQSTLPSKIAAIPYYASLFNSAYGSSLVTPYRISSAIAMFINAINTGNSRFELSARNPNPANGSPGLNALEIQGMQLFTGKYNCNGCHQTIGGNGSYNTETNFMNNGLDITYTDPGLSALTGNSLDFGKFKAPELHNIALTAPYMHDGRFKTLDDVLNFYSTGIQNSPNLDSRLRDAYGNPAKLNITEADKTALKAFLNSLTDYKMVTDPKFSDPFAHQ